MAVCGVYIVCRIFTTPSVHGSVYGLNLLKGNFRLGKVAMDTLHLSVMKKTAADLKSKGKKQYTHATRVINSCQGKVAGVLFTPTIQFINKLLYWM